MMHTVCSIRDSAINTYAQPFFAPSRNWALRSFTTEVNRQDDQNALWKHADDYELYIIAEFDDELAQFTHPEKPVLLARGKDVRNT